jgi:hypothetical protein
MTKQRNKLVLGAALVAATLSLAACGPVKRELGVDRNSPDEFLVVKRAPLTVPPDYTLRPPGNSAEAASTDATSAAEATLMGENKNQAGPAAADKVLLDKIGAAGASPDIRRQIDEDNGYIALKNRPVADKLIFWSDEAPSGDDAPASVVNPKAEAERLKKNKEAGKPVNEGNVPVIEKKTGTLDKIF